MAKKSLQVEIPRPSEDRPAWSRVGVVAAVGFIAGIGWPMLFGVTIGPNPPADARPAPAATAEPSASAVAAAPSASVSAAPAAPTNTQLVVTDKGVVERCSDKGKKAESCDAFGFDSVAIPRIEGLAQCPAALGLEGKLGIRFDVDFKRKHVSLGKGDKTSLPSSTVKGVLGCVGDRLKDIDLEKIDHEHERYTVVYEAKFYPPGKRPATGPAEPEEAASDAAESGADAKPAGADEKTAGLGLGTVAWETALLRSEPKDGKVVARATRGTRIQLIEKKGDWYKVEYRSKSGWVYRGALSL